MLCSVTEISTEYCKRVYRKCQGSLFSNFYLLETVKQKVSGFNISDSYKATDAPRTRLNELLLLGHRSLSKNIKQTAVTNIVRLRILIELNVSYAQQTYFKVTVTSVGRRSTL